MSIKHTIYFDNHATTPVDPIVFEAMRPYFCEVFGNAMSGQHSFGWEAKTAIEKAREQVASVLGAQARDIVFTSGATESIHLALLGFLELAEPGRHIVTSQVEHKCVLEVCAKAKELGHEVTVLPVNRYGQVEIDTLKNSLQPNTALVSLMHANNEIGSINPILEIGDLLRQRQITFHVDAAQTVGRLPIDVKAMNIDLLSISAHKLYGPKGTGALYVRQTSPRVRLAPYLRGGGQEKGLRGGTHNVPGIVGLGKACELAKLNLIEETARLTKDRDFLIQKCMQEVKGLVLNGHPTERLCNNINFTVSGVLSDQLLLGMGDVAFSSGSACSSGASEISHVLKAIGTPEDEFATTVRFGLGRFTTSEQVISVSEKLIQVVNRAREKNRTFAKV